MTYKIMIVDDEPANLRVLERLFRADYRVVTAPSGAEALALLEQNDVALMISDQRMPEMTGIELMTKTVDIRPHMVKILLTGYTDVGAIIAALNSGLVYRYLTKPWNNDDLRLTVSRALEHYEMMKAKHQLGMENQRLRAMLQEINEIASVVVNPGSVSPRKDVSELASSEPEVYELLG
ncbi:MAG: two-component system, NtrC family, response regulator HupR/HoxA [Blastocatellia bacterium]|jgi:two-component system response regulator HupR/HoxA|nr:two-component system, NtrC family, response regulator HupR/HoxA [Blastocatellia bacterium]